MFERMHITLSQLLKLIALIVCLFIITASYYCYGVINTYITNYRSLLVFDAKVDYTIPSSPEKRITIPLTLENNKIQWPSLNSNWDTGFIKLRVESNMIGQRLTPTITLSSQNRVIRQDFELGAKGTRFINISPLSHSSMSAGEVITLSSQNLTTLPTEAELVIFDNNKFGSDDRFLFLSPHPDDAEIAASGLYQQHNDSSWIVTITAGDAGGSPFKKLFETRKEQYLAKARFRVYDSVSIPQVAGIPRERAYNLGYFDGTLKKMFKDQSATVSSINLPFSSPQIFRKNAPFINSSKATWKNLVQDLASVIKDTEPTVIITPHPMLDSHFDHQYTTIAILEALKTVAARKPTLLMYTNHTMTELYPYGDRRSMISIPYIEDTKTLFDNLYSYNLTDKQRSIKLLTIDLMHDLKKTPSIEPYDIFTSIKHTKVDVMKRLRTPDTSYYRRSLRPNELFYVVESENVDAFGASLQAFIR